MFKILTVLVLAFAIAECGNDNNLLNMFNKLASGGGDSGKGLGDILGGLKNSNLGKEIENIVGSIGGGKKGENMINEIGGFLENLGKGKGKKEGKNSKKGGKNQKKQEESSEGSSEGSSEASQSKQLKNGKKGKKGGRNEAGSSESSSSEAPRGDKKGKNSKKGDKNGKKGDKNGKKGDKNGKKGGKHGSASSEVNSAETVGKKGKHDKQEQDRQHDQKQNGQKAECPFERLFKEFNKTELAILSKQFFTQVVKNQTCDVNSPALYNFLPRPVKAFLLFAAKSNVTNGDLSKLPADVVQRIEAIARNHSAKFIDGLKKKANSTVSDCFFNRLGNLTLSTCLNKAEIANLVANATLYHINKELNVDLAASIKEFQDHQKNEGFNQGKYDGKNGKDGKCGKDGKDGKGGKEGKDGKDGKEGKDGKGGKGGKGGKDGKDGR